jgi:hypothetical protein
MLVGSWRGATTMELTDAELPDAIVLLVERKFPRLKLSDEDISEMLFGTAYYRQRVNAACKWLVSERRLDRRGDGVANSPFWYRPPSRLPKITRRV